MSLLGVGVVVVGLLGRLNPILVVTAGALVTGLAAGLDPVTVIAALGKAFNDARYISVAFLVLPVIGLLERAGLQARARTLVARLTRVSVGALLVSYLAARQVTAALGLLSLGGQANMVRPLVSPMAEAADEARHGEPDAARRSLIRAHAAAVDNVGAFFGEDIFIALGSVLLVQAVLQQNHLTVQPLRVALWAIPTAVAAFAIHAARLVLLDRYLGRRQSLETPG
ncbi:MAG: DUF969 domain-containing protein [Caulobacteraceae bacterium]